MPRDVATVFADDEFLILGRLAGGQQAHQVAAPVLPAEHEILAAALERLLQHLGIGRGEIGRRQHIEHLPHRELDDRLVLRRHAAHAGRRVVPPLLSQQKRLREQIERRSFPLRPGKAPILRLRLDQGPGSLIGREIMQRSFEEAGSRFACASWAISICRCGADARCEAQSIKASDSATGDMPPVRRASIA